MCQGHVRYIVIVKRFGHLSKEKRKCHPNEKEVTLNGKEQIRLPIMNEVVAGSLMEQQAGD